MNNFGLNQKRLQAIRTVLDKYPQVSRVLVFGSRARGDFKHNSDIDLALYSMDRQAFPPELVLDLDEAAGIYKTNIIDMNEIDNETLLYQIREQGVEIYPGTEHKTASSDG